MFLRYPITEPESLPLWMGRQAERECVFPLGGARQPTVVIAEFFSELLP